MQTPAKILTAAAIAFTLLGCVTDHWQYTSRTTVRPLNKYVMNQYLRSGWQLVQVEQVAIVHTNASHFATTNWEYQYEFKRPKK